MYNLNLHTIHVLPPPQPQANTYHSQIPTFSLPSHPPSQSFSSTPLSSTPASPTIPLHTHKPFPPGSPTSTLGSDNVPSDLLSSPQRTESVQDDLDSVFFGIINSRQRGDPVSSPLLSNSSSTNNSLFASQSGANMLDVSIAVGPAAEPVLPFALPGSLLATAPNLITSMPDGLGSPLPGSLDSDAHAAFAANSSGMQHHSSMSMVTQHNNQQQPQQHYSHDDAELSLHGDHFSQTGRFVKRKKMNNYGTEADQTDQDFFDQTPNTVPHYFSHYETPHHDNTNNPKTYHTDSTMTNNEPTDIFDVFAPLSPQQPAPPAPLPPQAPTQTSALSYINHNLMETIDDSEIMDTLGINPNHPPSKRDRNKISAYKYRYKRKLQQREVEIRLIATEGLLGSMVNNLDTVLTQYHFLHQKYVASLGITAPGAVSDVYSTHDLFQGLHPHVQSHFIENTEISNPGMYSLNPNFNYTILLVGELQKLYSMPIAVVVGSSSSTVAVSQSSDNEAEDSYSSPPGGIKTQKNDKKTTAKAPLLPPPKFSKLTKKDGSKNDENIPLFPLFSASNEATPAEANDDDVSSRPRRSTRARNDPLNFQPQPAFAPYPVSGAGRGRKKKQAPMVDMRLEQNVNAPEYHPPAAPPLLPETPITNTLTMNHSHFRDEPSMGIYHDFSDNDSISYHDRNHHTSTNHASSEHDNDILYGINPRKLPQIHYQSTLPRTSAMSSVFILLAFLFMLSPLFIDFTGLFLGESDDLHYLSDFGSSQVQRVQKQQHTIRALDLSSEPPSKPSFLSTAISNSLMVLQEQIESIENDIELLVMQPGKALGVLTEQVEAHLPHVTRDNDTSEEKIIEDVHINNVENPLNTRTLPHSQQTFFSNHSLRYIFIVWCILYPALMLTFLEKFNCLSPIKRFLGLRTITPQMDQILHDMESSGFLHQYNEFLLYQKQQQQKAEQRSFRLHQEAVQRQYEHSKQKAATLAKNTRTQPTSQYQRDSSPHGSSQSTMIIQSPQTLTKSLHSGSVHSHDMNSTLVSKLTVVGGSTAEVSSSSYKSSYEGSTQSSGSERLKDPLWDDPNIQGEELMYVLQHKQHRYFQRMIDNLTPEQHQSYHDKLNGAYDSTNSDSQDYSSDYDDEDDEPNFGLENTQSGANNTRDSSTDTDRPHTEDGTTKHNKVFDQNMSSPNEHE